MLSKIYILSILIFLFSCKKEVISYDPEDNLLLDSLTMQIERSITFTSTTQIDVDVKILTINGLNTETNYASSIFSNPTLSTITTSIGPQTITTETPVDKYTALLLIESDQNEANEINKIGIYLKRFLMRNIDKQNIALAYFSNIDLSPIEFSSSQTNSILNTNWQYSIDYFYTKSRKQIASSSEVSIEPLIQRIDEAIDSITLLTTPNKSITIISEANYSDNTLYITEFNNLILKANTSQIQINFIGSYDNGMSYLVHETGGFTLGYRKNTYDALRSFSCTMMNLNLLFSKNYTTHNCTFTFTDNTGANVFGSNTYHNASYDYGNNSYNFDINIP